MSKKTTKRPTSNAFARLASSIAPNPAEAQSSDQLLEQQQAEQRQALDEIHTKEIGLDADLAARDAEYRAKSPVKTPTNSPFNPSLDKVRRYGLIKEVEAADIENSIFQRIRTSMFKTGKGGMFMFGTPDTVVLGLLMRVYNENVIRIAKEIPPLTPKLSAMLGVLNIDGAIYITISEDPREDDNYYRKTQLIYTLLTYANCNVIYDEENDDDPEVRSVFGSKWSYLFPKIPFVYRDLTRPPVACLTVAEERKTNDGLILGTGNRKGNSGYDFDRKIISDRIDVHFIHSLKYIVGRRPENPGTPSLMFPPIKKAAGDGRAGFHECANGSTCSEAKLFSYIHRHYDEPTGTVPIKVSRRSSRRRPNQSAQITPAEATFRRIRGYGAYWIPASNPPNHILGNYNYKLDANDKFATESTEIMNIIKQNVPPFMTAHVNTPQFGYFAQLFALPCPGCFLNYNNYITNSMTSYNLSTCVKTRKGRLYEGGKRRRKNKTMRKSVRGVNFKGGKHARKCRCRGRNTRK
jgi:hypothetical protein